MSNTASLIRPKNKKKGYDTNYNTTMRELSECFGRVNQEAYRVIWGKDHSYTRKFLLEGATAEEYREIAKLGFYKTMEGTYFPRMDRTYEEEVRLAEIYLTIAERLASGKNKSKNDKFFLDRLKKKLQPALHKFGENMPEDYSGLQKFLLN